MLFHVVPCKRLSAITFITYVMAMVQRSGVKPLYETTCKLSDQTRASRTFTVQLLTLSCVMAENRRRDGGHSQLSPSKIERAREAIDFLSSLAATESRGKLPRVGRESV